MILIFCFVFCLIFILCLGYIFLMFHVFVEGAKVKKFFVVKLHNKSSSKWNMLYRTGCV